MKHSIWYHKLILVLLSLFLLSSCKKEILLKSKLLPKTNNNFVSKYKYYAVGLDTVTVLHLGNPDSLIDNAIYYGIDDKGKATTLFTDTVNAWDLHFCKGANADLYALKRNMNEQMVLQIYDLTNNTKTKEILLNGPSLGSTIDKIFFNPKDNFIYFLTFSGLFRADPKNGNTDNIVPVISVRDFFINSANNNIYYCKDGGDMYKCDANGKNSILMLHPPSYFIISGLFNNAVDSKIYSVSYMDLQLREADIPSQKYNPLSYTRPVVTSRDFVVKSDKITFAGWQANVLYEIDLNNFSENKIDLTSINGNNTDKYHIIYSSN